LVEKNVSKITYFVLGWT